MVNMAYGDNLLMPVMFHNGAILLEGGQVAMHRDCCCCSVFVQLSFDIQNNALRALATDTSNTNIRITLTRNGVVIVDFTARNYFDFITQFAAGDVFVLTATGASCSATATCEIAPSYAVDTTCRFLDPTGVGGGACLTPDEYRALWVERGSISADISGLTGPMAALNGVYNAGCGTGSGQGRVFWQRSLTGFGPREYNEGVAGAGTNGAFDWVVIVNSRHSDDQTDFDLDPDKSPLYFAGSHIVRMTPQIVQPWTYRRQIATCATDCGNPITNFFTPGGDITDIATTNGAPAEAAIIVVTRIGAGV